MNEHRVLITPMEGDFNRVLPPATVLRQCLNSVLCDMKEDGCDRETVYQAVGATWMISRMRIYQYAQVNVWDTISYHTFPRVIENGRYIFYVEGYRDEELVIRFDSVFMPVDAAKRKVMDIEIIEPLWKAPPRQAQSKFLTRMDMECDYRPGGKQTVRYSDCDVNGHLTSPAYLYLVCDELGFWGGDARMMKFVQIDYASEVMPGAELRFEVGEKDGAKLLRGYKEDGKLAFSARCEF